MEELIVFTHNDLDALGCMLNIEHKFPNVPKKYYHTNYANIPTIVEDIEAYQKENGNKHLLIPDVSFSDNKDYLMRLYELFDHVTVIDHHMYPDDFWDAFPDMKVIWDKTKCATTLCYEYFGHDHPKLGKLSKLIEVYDIWQDKHPAFDISQDLNNYFWHAPGDIEWLMHEFIKSDFDLPANYAESVQKIKDTYTAAIAEYETKGAIKRAGDITFAFVDEWFNQILLKEHADGKQFVVGINGFGIVRVRINQDVTATAQQLKDLREVLTGNPEIGHLHAFTYKLEGPKYPKWDDIVNEAQKVAEAIQKTCA